MPSYRGVNQAELLHSIYQAIALLENHSTGPSCQAYIDDLKKPDAAGQTKLGAIATAVDDVALARAVGNSGVVYLFARGYEVLKYHALNNTDGKAYAVLKALNGWGATSAIMTLDFNQYDAEFGEWLKKHRLKALFNQALAAVTGRIKVLEQRTPMGRYGLVIDNLTSGKINWTDPSLKITRVTVEQALDPFYDIDEVGMTGIGNIGKHVPAKAHPQGIIFESTHRAALAVAAALPNMQVLDERLRRVVPPPAPPVAPKSGPTP